MQAVRFLFCIVCVVGMGSGDVFGWDVRADVLNIARKEIGVRELTGKNDGVRVEQYLKYTGLPKGHAWCASFVSWVFGQAGCKQPRTAWSPALFPKGRIVNPSSRTAGRDLLVKHSSRDLSSRRDDENLQGLVFGIYFSDLKRIAHVGFVERLQGNFIQTIEGNTSPDGSREGIGVFRRLRHKRTICKYSNWL